MLLRVFRDVVVLLEGGQKLFGDDSGVLIVGGVVLGGAVREAVAPAVAMAMFADSDA